MNKLNEKIAIYQVENKLTLQEIAKKAQISIATLSLILTEKRKPSRKVKVKLSKIGIKIDD